jgi:hypothetical protein
MVISQDELSRHLRLARVNVVIIAPVDIKSFWCSALAEAQIFLIVINQFIISSLWQHNKD